MSVKCEYCGKEFKNTHALAIHHGHRHPNKPKPDVNPEHWRHNNVELTCENCGKSFHRRKSHVMEHNFCSKQCFNEWKKDKGTLKEKNNPNWTEKVKVSCDYCGKDIRIKPSVISEHNFCSNKCRIEWLKETNILSGENHYAWKGGPKNIKCDFCGKEIEKYPSQIDEYQHHFCSQECHYKWMKENGVMRGEKNPSWKGGFVFFYGSDWHEQRRRALERDNYTCQICGKTKDEIGKEPSVHHIKPLREFKEGNGQVNYEKANKLSNLISLCPSCHQKVENRQAEVL